MKYVILVTKHHDGFCLWDSQYTEYDVARSGNTTNVIEAVARECKKQGIRLGLYYSLWDRKENPEVDRVEDDEAYNRYMLAQLDELMDITEKHTRIVELVIVGRSRRFMQPSKNVSRNVRLVLTGVLGGMLIPMILQLLSNLLILNLISRRRVIRFVISRVIFV